MWGVRSAFRGQVGPDNRVAARGKQVGVDSQMAMGLQMLRMEGKWEFWPCTPASSRLKLKRSKSRVQHPPSHLVSQ